MTVTICRLIRVLQQNENITEYYSYVYVE